MLNITCKSNSVYGPYVKYVFRLMNTNWCVTKSQNRAPEITLNTNWNTDLRPVSYIKNEILRRFTRNPRTKKSYRVRFTSKGSSWNCTMESMELLCIIQRTASFNTLRRCSNI